MNDDASKELQSEVAVVDEECAESESESESRESERPRQPATVVELRTRETTLEEISSAIEEGTYRVNSRRLARQMLDHPDSPLYDPEE